MKPSADYQHALSATQKFHTKNKGFSGRFLLRYLDDVRDIVRAHGCHTMLDYGCGRGEQYDTPLSFSQDAPELAPHGTSHPPVYIPEYLGLAHVQKYDPGHPPFAAEPTGRYDIVICTQVLGSIPVQDLRDWVLDRIFSFAIRAVYFGEMLTDAPRKTLHAGLASAGKMPHGWSREQWLELVAPAAARYPNIACYFRTKDKRKSAAVRGSRVLDTFNVQGK